MRRQQVEIEQQDNPFALSIGDLMAALLLIFVLLLASTLLKLQNEFENKSRVAERYTEVKEDLRKELLEEFKYDLLRWKAEIDKNDLIIRFKEPDTLFDYNESEVKIEFQAIIDDFFPRYIDILLKPKFIKNIEEIRIEGHTDSDGDYFSNMELSQDRTRSVLEYSLSRLKENGKREWVQRHLTANGLSSSKPRYRGNTNIEDKTASRRVEFRVRTNAEEQIRKMIILGGSK
ncbi:MAG: OmpA family protein [Candidatus Desantisbacteria bacterium]